MIFAFNVRLVGVEYCRIINANTAGQAKSQYFRDVSDCFPDLKFTDIRARKIGGPYSSADFIRTAENRHVPFARCGMRVEVGDWPGVIVGHNSSANFDVLFTEGPYKGEILNCHPNCHMRYFDRAGKLLLDTRTVDYDAYGRPRNEVRS